MIYFCLWCKTSKLGQDSEHEPSVFTCCLLGSESQRLKCRRYLVELYIVSITELTSVLLLGLRLDWQGSFIKCYTSLSNEFQKKSQIDIIFWLLQQILLNQSDCISDWVFLFFWRSPFTNVIGFIGLLMALLIGLVKMHECGPCFSPMHCSDSYAPLLSSPLLQAVFLLSLLCMSASCASCFSGQWMFLFNFNALWQSWISLLRCFGVFRCEDSLIWVS